jgi:hypothetical protein
MPRNTDWIQEMDVNTAEGQEIILWKEIKL